MEQNKIYNSDCLEGLKTIAGNSIDCCVTSPPYFGLRDYGHEGQIGLEETPEMYVDKIVQVFEEVRRVLKKEGTLWLNLGDSYSGSGKGGQSEEKRSENWQPTYGNKGKKYGLKSKDLIGIPWMVAFALRSPKYIGRLKNESDRIWLAAMIDGEGCFYIHRRKEGQHAGDGYFRKNDTYSCAIEVANTHSAIIERCMEITGVGSVTCQSKDRRQPLYRWTVRCDEAKQIAAELYPYVFAKRQQCRIIYNLPSNGEKAVAAWEAMKLLHAGQPTEIDFPEPKIKLLEDGWYLRQDLIWAKPNPMPESVTDRCTKAHEYIFLMSKGNKYYYNNEAIKYESLTYDNGIRDRDNTRLNNTPGRTRMKGLVTNDYDLSNKRSVWTITTKPYSEAHFATFPEDLIVDCIKAGCPEGGIVLDPFMGAGTTALVARKLNRNFIGFELNGEYIKIANNRLRNDLGMFQ